MFKCHSFNSLSRLKAFIQEAIEPYVTELEPLLFPLFVHVYMEMVSNGHKAAGEQGGF